MFIRCWGARGSIPVSGKDHLKYGGDTTCVEIQSQKGEKIILDAGTGIRRLGNVISVRKPTTLHVLFTHAHWDHILGFPFFKPLHDPRVTLNLYGGLFAHEPVTRYVAKTMESPMFPVPIDDVLASIKHHLVSSATPFSIGSLLVTPINLSHPNGGFGYKITEGRKTFVFLTDNELNFIHPGGCSFDNYVSFARECDLLIHDAEFTRREYSRTRGWGHSCYTDAVRLARSAGVKRLGLFHHNQDRRDKEIDSIEKSSQKLLVSHHPKISCFAVKDSFSIRL